MNKQVVIISGSPRKGGNSDTLCQEFQKGCEEAGNHVAKINLRDKQISFCTACYREGRTGDRFMSLCKSGQIQNCCLPNALMTLKEYLMDYASEDTRKKGLTMIQQEIQNIPKEKVREIVCHHLAEIEKGNRDFRF